MASNRSIYVLIMYVSGYQKQETVSGNTYFKKLLYSTIRKYNNIVKNNINYCYIS